MFICGHNKQLDERSLSELYSCLSKNLEPILGFYFHLFCCSCLSNTQFCLLNKTVYSSANIAYLFCITCISY